MEESLVKRIILIMLGILVFSRISAQESCAEKLKYAQELFESGQIEQIPALLDSCLTNGFTGEQRINAYRLLIQVHLFDYDRQNAGQLMVSFLREYPEYKLLPDDPVEFAELYRSFEVKPDWRFGLTLGIDQSQTWVKERFSTDNLNKVYSSYSPGGINFQAGVHADKYWLKNLWFSLDLRYSTIQFQRKDEMGVNREELTYHENAGWLLAPLSVNAAFITKGRFVSYVFAGGEAGYLVTDKADIRRHNLDNTVPDVAEHGISVRGNRQPFNVWLSGGIGFQYKVGYGFVNCSLGYSYGMMPYEDKNKRFRNINNLYYYQYVDDDFSVDRYFFSIGYAKLLYKVKKRSKDAK